MRAIFVLLLAAAVICAAPLLGLAAVGQEVAGYLAFPPRTRFVPHPAFERVWFVALSLPVAGAIALYWRALANARPRTADAVSRRRFPWWGWVGVILMAASWWLAWHEGIVPPAYRRHVFTPLWLGYIVAMNALVSRRTGHALVTDRTALLLALFVVSAGFWWLFEYLNQFAGNWHYAGIASLGDWDYFVQATLPFSTVLPAVGSTWAWLGTLPRLDAMKLPAIAGRAAFAWVALVAGVLSLAGIGLWPDVLFPMVWVAPLLILGGLQQLLFGESLFAALTRGDWRPVLVPALAGLFCGVLWELWNFGSLAKWHYSIPYVQRFHLFEMPLLGYAGYLPFGITCALVIDLAARCIERRAAWPLDR
jgi:hypothetical protein